MKRRALALSDEGARHPFRRSLPQHVRAAIPLAAGHRWRLSVRDWRDFLAAYCATFAAVTIFIS